MKKILILGGSHAEIPIIRAAKELGYFVITTGNKETDIGHKFSDKYIKEDYSNKEAMLNLVKNLKVNYICPGSNDFAALSASYISEKLHIGNFDNYKISQIIHNKDFFKKFATENNIPIPKAKGFSNPNLAINEIKNFKFPIIIKPVDLSGGKGITKIDKYNIKEIKKSLNEAFNKSRAKRIIIEEFIDGTNHGFTAIIKNKKLIFYFYDDEYYYKNKYLVAGASTSLILNNKIINQLIFNIEKIAKLLNLKDGIIHTQFILKNDEIYIIEVCRRIPGDLYLELVEYATNIKYAKLILKSFIGKKINYPINKNNNLITRYCLMPDKNGILSDIIFDKTIEKNIIKKFIWGKKGDIINDYLIYKAGIVFLKYETKEEMKEKTQKINKLIKLEIK
jgi:biotin carboxylase